MNFCNYCYTHKSEIEAKDKEIEGLKAALAAEVRLTVHAIETRDAELIAKDKEIEVLKARMCETCTHYATSGIDVPCLSCAFTTDLPKWELAK
jgi:hypothetical protein